jgi:Ras-related protein Rab-11A
VWKVVLVGDGAVGKTSLRRNYLGEGFESEYQQTFGADFALHDMNVGGTQIKWQIWDLAGQPEFRNVNKAYYDRIFGGVVVYDITRQETLDNIAKWVSDLWSNTGRNRRVPVVLLGNKIDLREENGATISTGEGREQAGRLGITKFIETCAKTGHGVEVAFEQLGKDILEFTRE